MDQTAWVKESESLPELLFATAAKTPNHIAITISDTRIPYGAGDAVRMLAQGFSNRNPSGDSVALLLPNTPVYVMATYALLQIGAVVLNVSPASQGSELLHILTQSQAVAIVTLDVFLPGLYRVLDKSPIKRLFLSSLQGLEQKTPPPPGTPRRF